MYTVMIIEDELLVRMGLVSSISWKSLGLSVVAEADNGSDAWEIYKEKKPDIIITDIRIPGMNGIELVKRIRAEDSTCAIIIITCVEEFAVLHEAMKYDIVAYLVKVTMRQKDIMETVKKARDYLLDHRRPSRKREDLIVIEDCFRKYFFERQLSDEDLKTMCGDKISEELCGFIHVRMSRIGGIGEMLFRSIRSIMSDELYPMSVTIVGDSEYSNLLILLQETMEKQELVHLVREFGEYCSDAFGTEMFFTISLKPTKTQTLPRTVRYIQNCCDRKYLYNQSVLFVNSDGTVDDSEINRCFQLLRQNVWYFREDNSVTKIRNLINAVEKEIFTNWIEFSNAMYRLARYIFNHSAVLEEDALKDFREMLKTEGSIQSLFSEFRTVILEPSIRLNGRRPEVQTAIEYIERHISEDISLTDVAAIVNLNASYFSKVFKEEMNIGFSDFLTILRIDRAKELLVTTSSSIQKVAEMSGFSDVSYFCRKFKSIVGDAPSVWRNI